MGIIQQAMNSLDIVSKFLILFVWNRLTWELENEAVSSKTSCECNVSESEDEQSSEPERDYDDHVVAPLVQIVCTRFLAKARRDLAN